MMATLPFRPRSSMRKVLRDGFGGTALRPEW
jgi:hypothetical protein